MSLAETGSLKFLTRQNKTDGLLRAAVSAYCGLIRPSRSDARQLDDLAAPLYATTSFETRRYICAALSKCTNPPYTLVTRLIRETIDIAAPLIVCSPTLEDAELVRLIATHGLPHARAIARRKNLNNTIRQLLRTFRDPVIDRALVAMSDSHGVSTAAERTSPSEDNPVLLSASGSQKPKLEDVRNQLRAFMSGPETDAPHRSGNLGTAVDPAGLANQLLTFAIRDEGTGFPAILSKALGFPTDRIFSIHDGNMLWEFMVLLRALQIDPPIAFCIASMINPAAARGTSSARMFLRRFGAIRPDMAQQRVARWRVAAGSDAQSLAS